jgi:hypothetical protein
MAVVSVSVSFGRIPASESASVIAADALSASAVGFVGYSSLAKNIIAPSVGAQPSATCFGPAHLKCLGVSLYTRFASILMLQMQFLMLAKTWLDGRTRYRSEQYRSWIPYLVSQPELNCASVKDENLAR